jgi:hypothetical protein
LGLGTQAEEWQKTCGGGQKRPQLEWLISSFVFGGWLTDQSKRTAEHILGFVFPYKWLAVCEHAIEIGD